MSTMTAQTYFARDLIELGEIHDGLVGLSIIDGRAPVLLIDWPGDSVEFHIGPALAAVLISAGNRAQRLALEDRMDTLPGLSGPWPDVSEPAPDLSGPTVPELVAAALA